MTTRHESTAVRRVQIMEAASKLIVARGSEHLTVKSIAREVGISEAAVYRHFKSKRDILFWLVDFIGGSLVNEIHELTHSGAKLDDTLKTHIASIERRRGTSFQVIAEIISFGDKQLNERAYQTIERYTSGLQALMDNASSHGAIKSVKNPEAALLISCLIQGLVNTWVLSNYRLDLKEQFAEIWQAVSG